LRGLTAVAFFAVPSLQIRSPGWTICEPFRLPSQGFDKSFRAVPELDEVRTQLAVEARR
jgi:hypothetical protein